MDIGARHTRPTRCGMWCIRLTLTAALAIAAQATPADAREPGVRVLKDFVAEFGLATPAKALAASASQSERSGSRQAPGIFLHPQDTSEDAILTYPAVSLPDASVTGKPVLLFHIGLRDGIPWDTSNANPNGVKFAVTVGEAIVFEENLAESAWKARAVDLSPWRGQEVAIAFHTNAIAANSSYDWAVFVRPLLVTVEAAKDYLALPEDSAGVALARIRCETPSSVRFSMGEAGEEASLQPGTHLIPLDFQRIEPVQFDVLEGGAKLVSLDVAPHTAGLRFVGLDFSSPLATAGRPFSALLNLENRGLGVYHGNEKISVEVAMPCGGPAPVEAPAIGTLPPGERRTYALPNLVSAQPGPLAVRCEIPALSPVSASVRVFPREPATDTNHSEQPDVSLSPGRPIAAVVSNAWSRLSFVLDESSSYAIAEAWNGAAWQRVGSLWPLARLVARTSAGATLEVPLRVSAFQTDENVLIVDLEGTEGLAAPCTVRVLFKPSADSPRIEMDSVLQTFADLDISAFYGPVILAGDRAFGVEKDFAIFPGLEYLEADEESSSERDLAYPSSDRRVPAAYKITTPLMAVQGRNALISLMWEANQEWAEQEKRPAARFLAPHPDSGYEHIHMSLFAPSVGEYVAENTYQADKSYHLPRGGVLRLESWLVLDHAARYSQKSLVHGPHRGALALEAMRHWFQVYGLPAPSDPPRTWGEERALCRDAYFNAIWSEEPPGWSHCHGWEPGLLVGHAVPLLADARAGTSSEVRSEIERHVAMAVERAIREQGPHYLWTNAGCHIVMGELPFLYGYVAESMRDFRRNALARLDARQNGLWIWQPQDEKHAILGAPGDHTLGQAAHASWTALRAARFTGDTALRHDALEAMEQMARYEVPRGAQVWECPLYQPDILAAGQAIRAYCEAYRMTGDAEYLAHARYWAWSGLPFIYMWELDGYPTMRYNVISVIGSTFFTHSWLGLPVVWCGLVYAYALQDLAEFDDSFDWRRVAEGITRSAEWQQYADGPSKGCYPDSWNMVKNTPNPADIGPENILMNGFRLRGRSPEIRFARFGDEPEAMIFLNSAADIGHGRGSLARRVIKFTLTGVAGFDTYSMLAPVPEPIRVQGGGPRMADSTALQSQSHGWTYDAELSAVVLKSHFEDKPLKYSVRW